MNSAGSLSLLQCLEAGLLRDIDVHLVHSLVRIYDVPLPESAQLVLALACRATGDGHVCLALDDVPPSLMPSADSDPDLRNAFAAAVAESGPVLRNHPRLVGTGVGNEPFVLEGSRLYLRRFWNYENSVAAKLLALAVESTGRRAADFETQLAEATPPLSEGQKHAIRCAIEKRFSILTGGPGTGKTFVAAHLLVMLAKNSPLIRIRMAAPTGKAAARMDESVGNVLKAMGVSLEKEPACTLERLLGYQSSSPYFRHNRKNPLPADIVLIDETSMIDLPKMAKLLDAIGSGTQLVLLGDQNQLASVEPGNVMAELCQSISLAPVMATLTESKRFLDNTPVAELAKAIQTGDPGKAWMWATTPSPDIRLHSSATFDAGQCPGAFQSSVAKGYREFIRTKTPQDAFAALSRFRVLCALRNGPQGSLRVNEAIEKILPFNREGEFYDHRVILVTQNNYDINLFNGDVGIVLHQDDGTPLACFEDGHGKFRKIPCRLLPEHETSFAMTIHKSQGSGFGRILVLLPDFPCPVMTRELLYTAVTRTESGVELWCEETTFKQAISQPTVRHMGLQRKLDASSTTPLTP